MANLRTISGTLPDIDGRVGEGLPRMYIDDSAVHVDDLAVGRLVKDNGGSIFAMGCVCSPEGAQDG